MPVTYFFDENMSESSANSIHEIRNIFGESITTIIREFNGQGTSDEDISNVLSQKNQKCVIVTQDDDFAKRELFKQIMKSKNMGLFLIKFPRGSKIWRQHVFMINHWEEIANKSINFPFAYLVKFKNKFSKI